MYKQTIAYEDKFSKNLREYYNSILNGRLMKLNSNVFGGKLLMDSIVDYNIQEKIMCNNFCSWVTIGDINSSDYNGNQFEYINFMSGEEKAFEINFSQFKYPMSLVDKGKQGFILSAGGANMVCTIDNVQISPQLFFKAKKGEKLLLIFSLDAITQFNSTKRCYSFAYETTTPNDIRKYIKAAQKMVLEDILDYPTYNIPSTTIKIEFENNSKPFYNHNVICDLTKDFAEKLFDEEFRDKFEDLLNKLQAVQGTEPDSLE